MKSAFYAGAAAIRPTQFGTSADSTRGKNYITINAASNITHAHSNKRVLPYSQTVLLYFV